MSGQNEKQGCCYYPSFVVKIKLLSVFVVFSVCVKVEEMETEIAIEPPKSPVQVYPGVVKKEEVEQSTSEEHEKFEEDCSSNVVCVKKNPEEAEEPEEQAPWEEQSENDEDMDHQVLDQRVHEESCSEQQRLEE